MLSTEKSNTHSPPFGSSIRFIGVVAAVGDGFYQGLEYSLGRKRLVFTPPNH